jgi:autotransporter-associated beta strand protein
VNGTIEWDGGASDTLWSTPGNWNLNRRIYSGDALVVAAGGVSTNDLGAIVVESATFPAGTAAHTAGASGASDALRVNESVSNLSESVQTFDLPVSIGESTFAVHATGDLVFRQGLAATAGVTPVVTKTGAGTLAIDGATWGGGLDLQAGAVVLSGQTAGAAILSSAAGGVRVDGTLDAGGAAVTLADDAAGVFGDSAVLKNGVFTYAPRSGGDFLALGERAVLTLTNNATLSTTAPIFEYATGDGRGVRVLDGSSLVFDNAGNGFISSKDNGMAGFLFASGGSTIILPRGRTYIAWPGPPHNAGRSGRIDVLDGSFIAGGSVEFAWRAGRADFTLTNSAASFTDGLYLDANSNIDYSHSHMHVSGSVVTAGVWRVGNAAGKVHSEANPDNCTELVFDDATLVAYKDDTDAEPWFKCTKPDCDQIRILAGGLAVDTTNTVTLAAPLVGAGGLTKLGSGTLTVASTNSYAGATVVSNGTLRLTGRVAGPIAVAAGGTLALPIPAAGEEVPVVPSIVVEPGAALEAIVPGLPQGVACVDVLRTTGAISLATQAGDSAHKRFFAGPSKGGMALRYGNPPGMTIIIR